MFEIRFLPTTIDLNIVVLNISARQAADYWIYWWLSLLLSVQDGSENRLVESLSLIDAVMPDIVATRQNQQNQQKQQMIKSEPPEANGEETKPSESLIETLLR